VREGPAIEVCLAKAVDISIIGGEASDVLGVSPCTASFGGCEKLTNIREILSLCDGAVGTNRPDAPFRLTDQLLWSGFE
jgi:hypothetical protein